MKLVFAYNVNGGKAVFVGAAADDQKEITVVLINTSAATPAAGQQTWLDIRPNCSLQTLDACIQLMHDTWDTSIFVPLAAHRANTPQEPTP
jgi:hypothetical protein